MRVRPSPDVHSQRARGLRERSNYLLARPRELRGRMFKGIVPIELLHLTKRALDAGESARFQAVFYTSAFFHLDGVPPSAPAQVTQAVRRLAKIEKK